MPPVLSPDGKYVGEVVDDNGQGTLSGFDTGAGGEGLGGVPIDLGDQQDGSAVRVRGVTDDGRVIAQGTKTAVLWLPLVDTSTVDLTRTAPGLQVLGNTPAGSPEFKKLLTEYHAALMENLPYIPVGEYNSDSAWRKDRLEYTSTAPYVVFWNMVRK